MSAATGSATHDTPRPRGGWQAGDLVVSLDLQRVERAGKPVELPKLSFDLLVALIEAAPRFLSIDELMTRVWGNLVVNPETVTQRMKLLRDALGDDARQPRYFEGLRGRGYRLIPPAHRLDMPLSQAARDATRGPGWRWALLITLLLAGAGSIVLWVRWHEAAPPVTLVPADVSRTTVILPFESDGEEKLGAGLADSIAAQLSHVQNLTVISQYSTAKIDLAHLGADDIGRKLGARYLVRGEIQHRDARLRVSVSLVDSQDGHQLWTRQFTSGERAFFELQDEVAKGLKHALESRIAGLDPGLPPMERSSNRSAWFAFLRGRALMGRSTVVGAEAAAREFEQSLSQDPGFVPAMAALYDARMQAARLRYDDLARTRTANAALLTRARALEPGSPAVQLVEAIWSSGSDEQRVAGFEAGLARDPANARAMTEFSELLDRLGRRDEGKLWLDRALRVDPLWPRANFRLAQRSFPVVGSAVERQNMRSLELDPLYYPALQRNAKYQWSMHGETAYAISVIEKAIASDPDNPWGYHTAVALYLDAGDPQAAAAVARIRAVSEASTRALRAQYRGDWRAAGEAAYAAQSRVFSKPERWLVSASIRDYALHTGEYQRAMDYFSAHFDLGAGGAWNLTVDNFREAQMLAHLLLRSGHQDEALRGLDEVIAWNKANAHLGPVFHERTTAQALALKGDLSAAFAELKRSFEDSDHTFWWYTLRWDPTWDALRGDPRFAQLLESESRRAASQLAKLRQFRESGLVPSRLPPPALAGPALR